MPRRDESLLAEIERDALDHSVPLSAALQKCIALGGQTRNAELRDWASHELEGYLNDNKIPEYRIIRVPLFADTDKTIGIRIYDTHLRPDMRKVINEEFRLTYGVGELQAFVRSAERDSTSAIKMYPDGERFVARLLNHEPDMFSGHFVDRVYWDVSIVRIEGVLDKIRTTLIRLVSEMRTTMSDDALIPSSEQAAQAVNVVLHGGKRNQISVTAAQADNGATASIRPIDARKESGWTKTQTIWTVIGVIVALIALYVAYKQSHG